jgi:DNA-binding transcriptional MerR regulator
MYPNEKNTQLTKRYYTIGEVAKLFKVATSLIRFWEKEFPMLQPCKNKQGVRSYTQQDISKLERIYQLVKEQGYTLQGAKQAMEQSSSKPPSREAIIVRLKQLRGSMVELRDQMTGRAAAAGE